MIDGYTKMKMSKWSVQDQAYFLKRVGELLSRGYPLAEAVESLALYLSPRKKQEIIHTLSELREGYPFYKILKDLKFNQQLIGYVFFAEQHGGLAASFQAGSEMMLKRNKDMQKIQKIFFYPILLILITGFLFLFVERVLLPRFISLFQTMNLKTNFFVHVIMLFSDVAPILFYVGVVIISSFVIYYFLKFRKLPLLSQRKIIVKIPLIGRFFCLVYTHYFTVQLSYLITSGISIFESLMLFEKNIHQPFYQEVGNYLITMLRTGEKLDEVLRSLSIFDQELVQIVKHGQENGKLDQELFFYSNHCLNVLEDRIEKTIKTIHPCLYGIVGILIISMYLAVLLPMFHLLDGF
ncbi:competence type IV pilus assembly protein ComGB [Bacillus sp. 03113]|uniref:competence type IV pilus assembly protein ComGB n=1 Tax=Bacillus sp. 03113 TaxID=2578211 RepID=UPI00215BEDAF|nr:competence type IV pilus assembly protein ComGB [Bacillus sp. 03113]